MHQGKRFVKLIKNHGRFMFARMNWPVLMIYLEGLFQTDIIEDVFSQLGMDGFHDGV